VLDVRTVFVIENETSYLALPDVPQAVDIFGQGFGLTALERLPWLQLERLAPRTAHPSDEASCARDVRVQALREAAKTRKAADRLRWSAASSSVGLTGLEPATP